MKKEEDEEGRIESRPSKPINLRMSNFPSSPK